MYRLDELCLAEVFGRGLSALQRLGEFVHSLCGGLLILREIEQCETGCCYGNAPWASEQVDDAAAHGFQSGHDA